MVKTLVIAGTQSGVGKTTIAVGLIAALRGRGLTVQPFKVGPDYIDPGHHTLVAGRPCRNLDTWLMSAERMRALFERGAHGADVAIVEGVMGLYDGVGYEDETASTAQIAKLLGAPVLLVVDAAKVARSAAALASGFQRYDPAINLAGFIVNRAGSDRHGRGIATAIAKATGLPVLGWLPRDEDLLISERHLGLIPSAEPGPWSEFARAAAARVASCVAIDKVLEIAVSVPTHFRPEPEALVRKEEPAVVIAVARDEAFHFCYEENLAVLEEAGATIRFFSPIHDPDLPTGTAGILLSGGFPELYAAALSANAPMRAALQSAHAQAMPIYAECGGLMVLTDAIVDFEGRSHPMMGLLPGHSVMTRKLTLGYRRACSVTTSWLFPEPETIRGHEFHYSDWQGRPDTLRAAYELTPASGDGKPCLEGASVKGLCASYLHVHFWGNPELARRFVAACERHQS